MQNIYFCNFILGSFSWKLTIQQKKKRLELCTAIFMTIESAALDFFQVNQTKNHVNKAYFIGYEINLKKFFFYKSYVYKYYKRISSNLFLMSLKHTALTAKCLLFIWNVTTFCKNSLYSDVTIIQILLYNNYLILRIFIP